MAEGGPRNGYLLIADISGYTALLTGTELEHAQGIIEDLVRVIHRTLVPSLTFVKMEGDALFCYGDAARFTDGDRFLELIETAYYEFHMRLVGMERHTTCTCAACASIHTLDLKFVGHFGEFVVRRLLDAVDLAGPDVILVHRLLKNRVTEETGLRGYLLVTDSCAKRLPSTAAWARRSEHVETIGEVVCAVQDLKPSSDERTAKRRVIVEAADADFTFTERIAAPPSAVWHYWVDDEKHLRWASDMRSITHDRGESGRMGDGAIGHCDHGSWASEMRYVDWQPFSYFTVERVATRRSLASPPPMMETLELEPIDENATELHYRMRAHTRGGRLSLRLFQPMIRRMFRQQMKLLAQVVREDATGASP